MQLFKFNSKLIIILLISKLIGNIYAEFTKYCNLPAPSNASLYCGINLSKSFTKECVRDGEIKIWASSYGNASVQCNSTSELNVELVFENGKPVSDNSVVLDQIYSDGFGIIFFWSSDKKLAVKYCVISLGLKICILFSFYEDNNGERLIRFCACIA